MTGLVDPNRLRSPTNSFEYNQIFEKIIMANLQNSFGLICDSQTTGSNSDYDFIFDDYKIEMKVKTNMKIQVHYLKNDMPTSLLLSTSDFFLFISPGKVQGVSSMKLRLVSTAALKKFMINNHKPNQINFEFMFKKNISHIYLGYIPLVESDLNKYLFRVENLVLLNDRDIRKEMLHLLKKELYVNL